MTAVNDRDHCAAGLGVGFGFFVGFGVGFGVGAGVRVGWASGAGGRTWAGGRPGRGGFVDEASAGVGVGVGPRSGDEVATDRGDALAGAASAVAMIVRWASASP